MELQFRLTYVKLNFNLIFHSIEVKKKTLIFEDKSIEVFAFPLKHRIACYGYLFKEKPKERGVIKEMIDEQKLSIAEIVQLKKGNDVTRESGEVLNHLELTLNPPKQQSYAFCTDTKYIESLKEIVAEVDILYHEATFTHDLLDRAKATYHTTGKQAATLAKNANVKQLILGHFSQRYGDTSEIENEAKAIFENTTCVRDGDQFLL
jgi:ribonuclease Z